jgi:hypothetical protein
MAVTSRDQLKQYALRALGHPVVEINADDDQLEDRLDEALEYWRLYHPDGVEKLYMKHVISASELKLNTNNADQFMIGEVVTSISGGKAVVVRETSRESTGNTLLVKNVQGNFVNGSTITGTNSGTTAVLGTPGLVLGSYDKKFIEIPDLVYGVIRILPFSQASSSKNLFDLQYQLRLNDLYDLTSTSIIYYKNVMSYLALLDLELNGHPQFRFNRRQSKLFLDINWESDVVLGDFIVAECYRALDPIENAKVWDDAWLKHYTTALFKKQWATNIKKFQGIQLVGGVTLDGNALYEEAKSEIEDLETDLRDKSAPLDFFLG